MNHQVAMSQSWCSSSGIPSYACSLVQSELSWWGLKSSLHLHVAHMHYGSHYSVRSPYQLKRCHVDRVISKQR
jgi:hypothetical protein